MACAIVIDTETTGLFEGPKRSPADLLHIIEVGAVVIDTEFQVLDEFELVVNPGERIARHPQCNFVYNLTGLSAEVLLSQGVPPAEAAVQLAEWACRARDDLGVRKVSAFNNAFDFWFLGQQPWAFLRRTGLTLGRCIMEGSMEVMGPAGALPHPSVGVLMHNPTARWKQPRADEAAVYFREKGYPIPLFGGAQHRALPDARVEAAIMVAVYQEDRKLNGT